MYKVMVDEEILGKEIENMQKRYGPMTNPDSDPDQPPESPEPPETMRAAVVGATGCLALSMPVVAWFWLWLRDRDGIIGELAVAQGPWGAWISLGVGLLGASPAAQGSGPGRVPADHFHPDVDPEAPPAAPAYGGSLYLHMDSMPRSLNRALEAGIGARWVHYAAHDYLLHQDCGSCHGMTLKGGLGPSLLPEALAGKPAGYLRHVIANGVAEKAMPPWSAILLPGEIDFLVQYLTEGAAPVESKL